MRKRKQEQEGKFVQTVNDTFEALVDLALDQNRAVARLLKKMGAAIETLGRTFKEEDPDELLRGFILGITSPWGISFARALLRLAEEDPGEFLLLLQDLKGLARS